MFWHLFAAYFSLFAFNDNEFLRSVKRKLETGNSVTRLCIRRHP